MIERKSWTLRLFELFKEDKKIVIIFALYGLFAGIISFVSSLSYDEHYLDTIASFANYPFVIVLFVVGYNFSVPESVFPAIIILGSVAVWSFIGFIAYLFLKLFKLKDNFQQSLKQ